MNTNIFSAIGCLLDIVPKHKTPKLEQFKHYKKNIYNDNPTQTDFNNLANDWANVGKYIKHSIDKEVCKKKNQHK